MLHKRRKAPPDDQAFLHIASHVFQRLLSFEDLLNTIMEKVIGRTQSTRGFLILVGPDGGLDFKVARNMDRAEIENPKNRISRNLIARVVQEGRSLLTPHAGQDSRFRDVDSVHNLSLKSILCVPIRCDGRVLGVIYLENHLAEGIFDEAKRQLVEDLAEKAGVALGFTTAFESLRGERDLLEVENRTLRELVRREPPCGPLIGRSAEMAKLERRIARLAGSSDTVLILGESGTGKDLVARLLHDRGPKRKRPFVAVNCPAVPANLFESELFGHVRGAFTGAHEKRVGRVEAAGDGTLFLDEVGDLPRDVQPKLLRLLEQGSFERVGDNRCYRSECRVMAATNQDLHALVRQGRFREDLYYRLSVLPVSLPPLRERAEDIPELAGHFLRLERSCRSGFSDAALEFLKGLRWPGNVRELRSVVKRVAVFAPERETIGVDLVREQVGALACGSPHAGSKAYVEVPGDVPHREAVHRMEGAWLREMLRRFPRLSRSELAEKLGMSRRTLFQRLRRLEEAD